MKKFTNGTIRKYIDDLAAKKATPGGGSVAALIAAMGVGLISMVSQFSNKNKEIKKILKNSSRLKKQLIKLVDDDVLAYNKVKVAYSKPKKTESQRVVRMKTIEKSLKGALDVPKQISQLSYECLKLVKRLTKIGNKNLISDTAMSALLLHTSFHSALYNVKINLKNIKDKKFNQRIKKQMQSTTKKVDILNKEILKGVNEVL